MNDTIIRARTETRILRPGEGPDRNTPCVRVFRHSPGFVDLLARTSTASHRSGITARSSLKSQRQCLLFGDDLPL